MDSSNSNNNVSKSDSTPESNNENQNKKVTNKNPNKIDKTNIILQVIGGVVISIIIYWLSLFAINRDKLVITDTYTKTNKPTKFPLIKGYIDCVSASNIIFNTFNPESKTYTPLPRSVNRKGGAQFSYNYWLYMDDVSSDNVKNKVILCRGDMKKYNYSLLNKQDNKIIETGSSNIIKCPMISFGSNYKEIIAEFNTVDKFNEKITIVNNLSETNSALRRNVMSLTPHYWVMFTFVFEDNVPINDFENGIVVKFYINDTLYQVHKVKSMIRQNNGDLYILPDEDGTGMKSSRICDVNYYNYALQDTEIKNLYIGGPTKTVYTRNSDFGKPLYLAASNRIDQTNM